MKPISLTLKNFAGILSGQGKKEITLQLDAIPAEAKIVAIAGKNGAGKTTIMDNLHPYRLMPSRASNFSFYDHISDGEGVKDLVWEHKGVRYQSVLRFRTTAKTKKTEAYLYEVKSDGTTVPWMNPQTGDQSDGKTDTYDRAIESILGKAEVFFQAQFSAQGKEPIGSMSAADVKRLIADMIGANRSSDLSGKANEIVKVLKPRLSAMQDEVNRSEQQIPNEGNLSNEIARIEAQLEQDSNNLTSMSLRDAELVSRIATAGSNAQQQEAARAQHAAFAQQLAEAVKQNEEALIRIDGQRSDLTKQAQQAIDTAKKGLLAAETVVKSLKSDIAREEGLAATVGKVQAASEAIQKITLDKQAYIAQLDDLTPKLLKMEEVQGNLNIIASTLAGVKKDGEHLVSALEIATRTAALLSEVPCQGTDLAGQCKLLLQANQAGEKIPETQIKLTTARTNYKAHKEEQSRLSDVLNDLKQASTLAATIKEAISKCNENLMEQQAIAATADSVKRAQDGLPELRQQLQKALDDQAQAQEQVTFALVRSHGVEDRLKNLVEQTHRDHASRMEGLERLRASLPVISEGDDVQVLLKQQDELRAEIKRCEAAKAVKGQELANTKARLDQAAVSRQALLQQRKRCESLATEISHWVLLAKALGTDGIIAMSIDDAGPAISEIANSLLEDCYGGRFAISLVTQKDTQAGITKETFRIEVEDNDRGERKFLELMSGGEKVWINECLVRAIALYMAQVADTRSQTLFSDESDGALDPGRKRQYMAMKSAVIERGGYDREYLITQTPELLEMCDWVIDVTNV